MKPCSCSFSQWIPITSKVSADRADDTWYRDLSSCRCIWFQERHASWFSQLDIPKDWSTVLLKRSHCLGPSSWSKYSMHTNEAALRPPDFWQAQRSCSIQYPGQRSSLCITKKVAITDPLPAGIWPLLLEKAIKWTMLTLHWHHLRVRLGRQCAYKGDRSFPLGCCAVLSSGGGTVVQCYL